MKSAVLWGIGGWVLFAGMALSRAESPGPASSSETVTYPPAYNGFQASRDAQAYWDARRVDAINRQLGWNELFKWPAATAAPSTIAPSTLYYAPYVPLRWDTPWLDGTPWPYGVGRIYGYGFYDPVPQPIGRREVQTGPNRWESHPVYADEVAQPAVPLVAPPVELPAPSPAQPVQGREF